jgi:multidrug efflux pump subunit AcrB
MKAATKLVEEAKARFPQNLDYVTTLDTTLAVSAGIREIVKTLFEALALVLLVVFIFLQGFRAIPSAVISAMRLPATAGSPHDGTSDAKRSPAPRLPQVLCTRQA